MLNLAHQNRFALLLYKVLITCAESAINNLLKSDQLLIGLLVLIIVSTLPSNNKLSFNKIDKQNTLYTNQSSY